MKKQSKPTHKPGVEIWLKGNEKNEGFLIESVISRMRLRNFLEKNKGEWIKMELFRKSKPKSEEALGYWWGGLLPSFVCHNKGIRWKDEPFFVSDLIKNKQISSEEIREAHDTLMTEFRPIMIHELRTKKPSKQRGRMEEMNNSQVIELITEVLDYFADQGYPIPDSEKYKSIRDSAQLVKTKKLK